MQLILTGKNMELTAALKTCAEQKLAKLGRLMKEYNTIANVVLSVEKDRHTVEVSVPIGRFLLRAEASTPDMYASFDAVTMKLE
ncbi:MAG: ribosome-associated translation inhibitor RaiA, partial [Firmicutes bacterium]|nr:ribosome-associated translation inhibitor RaiA [Bacillota bacterium]